MSAVDFSRFIKFFQESYRTPLSLDVLTEALQLFDPQHTGRLSLSRLRDILTYTDTEPLRGDDLDGMMRLAASLVPEDGPHDTVDYVAFAEK